MKKKKKELSSYLLLQEVLLTSQDESGASPGLSLTRSPPPSQPWPLGKAGGCHSLEMVLLPLPWAVRPWELGSRLFSSLCPQHHLAQAPFIVHPLATGQGLTVSQSQHSNPHPSDSKSSKPRGYKKEGTWTDPKSADVGQHNVFKWV